MRVFSHNQSPRAFILGEAAPFPFRIYPDRPMQPPPGGRSRKYFPDLSNKLNCVYSLRYEDWMMTDGYEGYYLFDNAGDCCDMWSVQSQP